MQSLVEVIVFQPHGHCGKQRLSRARARQPILDRDGFPKARVIVGDRVMNEQQGPAMSQFGNVQQYRLDEPQVREAQGVVLVRVLTHSRALARFTDQFLRRLDEELCDGSREQDAPRRGDHLPATEPDDRVIAARDGQLAGPGGGHDEGFRGHDAADPLMPRHLPERHADVDQSVNLKPTLCACPALLYRNEDSPRICHWREPPQLPDGKSHRLAERVSHDGLKDDRPFAWWGHRRAVRNERDTEDRRASLLRCQARVVADVEEFIENRLLWQVHPWPASR